jgi:hypothetical protein
MRFRNIVDTRSTARRSTSSTNSSVSAYTLPW